MQPLANTSTTCHPGFTTEPLWAGETQTIIALVIGGGYGVPHGALGDEFPAMIPWSALSGAFRCIPLAHLDLLLTSAYPLLSGFRL